MPVKASQPRRPNRVCIAKSQSQDRVASRMSADLAFLARLSLIADRAASDVARTAARALVDACKHCLYDRLGIVRTRRPTTRAREDAKDELDALRRMVFRAEESAEPSASRIYATARQPIDMARRALDLRLVYQEGSASQDIRQPADS